ncbi:hypothetical protein ACFQHO_26470 [Actinomadura yumaensis]|uniref:hypothetical protein n=1 Tax=Actinomadura yumaensis TaxID=111807 RepID=UPI00361FA0E4
MREGFSPEMAMAPVVGNAPPDLGGAPPDAEDEVETAHHEAPAQPRRPRRPRPSSTGRSSRPPTSSCSRTSTATR